MSQIHRLHHVVRHTTAHQCQLQQQTSTDVITSFCAWQLACCLIYAQPFRHTALPQTTTPSLAAQATTWQMIGRCHIHWQPMPISLLVWVHSFIEPALFDNNVPFDNTTDQSALEIRVRI